MLVVNVLSIASFLWFIQDRQIKLMEPCDAKEEEKDENKDDKTHKYDRKFKEFYEKFQAR